jgi:hypothetical protein
VSTLAKRFGGVFRMATLFIVTDRGPLPVMTDRYAPIWKTEEIGPGVRPEPYVGERWASVLQDLCVVMHPETLLAIVERQSWELAGGLAW